MDHKYEWSRCVAGGEGAHRCNMGEALQYLAN